MSHRRREMSQSAENVVNPNTGICRIVNGKCRKKIRCRYMSQHRREMSQLLLIPVLHFDDFEFICDYNDFIELKCKLVGLNVCKMIIDGVIWIFCLNEFGK